MITFLIIYILYALLQGVIVTRFDKEAPKELGYLFLNVMFAPLITIIWLLGGVAIFLKWCIGAKT